jgi:HSP20 family protein
MTVFDPFADLGQLRRQIDRLFDTAAPARRPADGSRVWGPAVDMFEDEETLTVRLDLPEVDQASLDVQLADEELRITGERKWVAPAKGKCIHSERPYGQFYRAFRVGIPVQADKVSATYRDGVLSVHLPKAEAIRPRKVSVQLDAPAASG